MTELLHRPRLAPDSCSSVTYAQPLAFVG